jgi:hypothetical protein
MKQWLPRESFNDSPLELLLLSDPPLYGRPGTMSGSILPEIDKFSQAGPSRPTLRRNPSSRSNTAASESTEYHHQSDKRSLSPVDALSPSRSPVRGSTGSYPHSASRVTPHATRRILRAMSRCLPPSVKRLFSKSPLVGLTVGLMIITGLYILYGPMKGGVGLTSSGWRGEYGYPPSTTDPNQSLNSLDTSTDLGSNSRLVLPDLPNSYLSHIPTLQLPSSLLSDPKYHNLASRLHAFLNRPINNNEINERECPRRLNDRLVNPDQYNGEIEYWNRVSDVDVIERRSQIVGWLGFWADSEKELVGSDDMSGGRGIVLTGGNQVSSIAFLCDIIPDV